MKVFQYVIYEVSLGIEVELINRLTPGIISEDSLVAFLKCNVITNCLKRIYSRIPEIETLPEDQKKEIWNYVYKLFPGTSRDYREIISKMLYTLNFLAPEVNG